MIRNEVECLCCLNVLRRCNESEWAAPSFGTPKKNGQIRFVSDFRQLNKWIIRRPYPMPSIHELFKRFEGFTYCTALDLNMGFWTILHDKFSQHLCTIILPWGKYCYFHLPMGLACSLDIYQEKMSELFIDMTFVIVYKTTSSCLPLVHLTTIFDNSAMSSNDSIATTFKSMPRNQASVHWRLNT
jgi:hypothetical protein